MIAERRAAAVGAVEGEVRSLLHRVRRVIGGRAHAVHPELQGSSYLLLGWLEEHGPARATAVVDALGVDKGSLSRQLHHLEDLGLIERRADPDDGRAMLVVLTEEALDRLRAIDQRERHAMCERLADWSEADLEDLAERVGRYNEAIG